MQEQQYVGQKRELDDSDASELDLSGSSSRNNSPPNKRPKFERSFVPAWLTRYPWLRYENERNQMFCELCVKYRKSNAFTEGCQNFRRDNLNKHMNTQDHRSAQQQQQQESVTLQIPPACPLSPALPTSALGGTTVPISLTNGVVHLGDTPLQNGDVKTLPITPNYLANPPFPYLSQPTIKPHMIDVPMNLKVTPLEEREEIAESVDGQSPGKPMNHSASHIESLKYNTSSPVPGGCPQPSPIELRFSPQQDSGLSEEEMVLKIRIADSQETDYIEVELDRSNLTFENLLNVMCHELQVDRKLIQKVRKLPNTKLRKDKDVKRLRDYTELELVLVSSPVVDNSRTPQNNSGISPRSVGVVLY